MNEVNNIAEGKYRAANITNEVSNNVSVANK